jgi:hypothetical protein
MICSEKIGSKKSSHKGTKTRRHNGNIRNLNFPLCLCAFVPLCEAFPGEFL